MNRELMKELENEIIKAYEEGVTLDSAETLASRFLHAQIQVSEDLRNADLDARMKKTGVKSIRAAVYTETVSTAEKRPTEAAMEHLLNSDELVVSAQNAFDTAEVDRDELERYFSIFQNAHVHFRTVARGRFEG